MPLNLQEVVGPAGLWGDVNAILQENLQAMKVRPLEGSPRPGRGLLARTAAWPTPRHAMLWQGGTGGASGYAGRPSVFGI